MADYTAGRFRVRLGGPHPIGIYLEALHRNGSDEVVARMDFDHREIADLRHVLDRATAEAKRRLKGDASEVE